MWRDKGSISWFADVLVNGVKVYFKLDTGSEVDILPVRFAKAVGIDGEIVRSPIRTEAYGGFPIKPIEEATTPLR